MTPIQMLIGGHLPVAPRTTMFEEDPVQEADRSARMMRMKRIHLDHRPAAY
ncbi:MAG: hypothetical protein KGI59_03400 [Patescibacteria group bacterium]|nr:hypothetical protein [Patescibacteria group bacterium]